MSGKTFSRFLSYGTSTSPAVPGTFDFLLTGSYAVTPSLGANAYTIANLAEGTTGTVTLTSPGAHTIVWGVTIYWSGGAAPTPTQTAGRLDVYTFRKVNGLILGSVVQNLIAVAPPAPGNAVLWTNLVGGPWVANAGSDGDLAPNPVGWSNGWGNEAYTSQTWLESSDIAFTFKINLSAVSSTDIMLGFTDPSSVPSPYNINFGAYLTSNPGGPSCSVFWIINGVFNPSPGFNIANTGLFGSINTLEFIRSGGVWSAKWNGAASLDPAPAIPPSLYRVETQHFSPSSPITFAKYV